jgi:hypothetical protein
MSGKLNKLRALDALEATRGGDENHSATAQEFSVCQLDIPGTQPMRRRHRSRCPVPLTALGGASPSAVQLEVLRAIGKVGTELEHQVAIDQFVSVGLRHLDRRIVAEPLLEVVYGFEERKNPVDCNVSATLRFPVLNKHGEKRRTRPTPC